MLRYTLRQLEYALAALELGSVARASERLGVAQPTLSAAIAKLEDQIGLQLFIRHHAQGVSAAPQAREFFAEARNLVNHGRDIERMSQRSGTAISGRLSLGSFTTIASIHAPKLIAGFSAEHPEVTIRLEESAQEELLDGLREGRHDVSLLYDVDLPDDIEARPLARLTPHILLPKPHPLAARRKITLQAVAELPLVLLDVAPSRTYFTRILRDAGVTPHIAFSSPSLEVVRGLVGQGLGYSILITRPFGDHSYSGEPLAIVPIADKVEAGVIALGSLRSLRKTRLVSTFEDYCAGYFGDARRRH